MLNRKRTSASTSKNCRNKRKCKKRYRYHRNTRQNYKELSTGVYSMTRSKDPILMIYLICPIFPSSWGKIDLKRIKGYLHKGKNIAITNC